MRVIMNLGGLRIIMPVVSVSLPDVLVQQMDVAVAREGAKGRSAFVRAAIRDRVDRASPTDVGTDG